MFSTVIKIVGDYLMIRLQYNNIYWLPACNYHKHYTLIINFIDPNVDIKYFSIKK